MMDPDDFRACLISMGYDLVSAPCYTRLFHKGAEWLQASVPTKQQQHS